MKKISIISLLVLTLTAMPGSQAKYSNVEYIILSQIMEQVTMKEFSDLTHSYILKPLKMKESDFSYNKHIKENQVYGTLQYFSLIDTV